MTSKQWHQEHDKLKKMSVSDKIWYIWAYYKIPILITAAVLFLIFQAACAIGRSRQECMLYCAFFNQTASSEKQTDRLREDFYRDQDFSGRQVITFDTSINLTDEAYRNASQILFQSLIGTQTLDIAITKQDIIEEYADREVWLDLRDVLPSEMFDRLQGEIYSLADTGGEGIPAGLFLKNSRLVSEYGMDEDSVLCVCNRENHPDVIVDFVAFLFDL